MKNRKCGRLSLFLTLSLCFTACQAGDAVSRAPFMPAPSDGASPQSALERVAEKSGLKMERTSFSRGYQVSFSEVGTAYIASNNDGGTGSYWSLRTDPVIPSGALIHSWTVCAPPHRADLF